MERISAFGDSVLQGIILKDGRYHICNNRFTNILNQKHEVEIRNNGFIGHTINDLPKMMLKAHEQIEDTETGIVLLEYGGNDCDFIWQDISENPEALHTSRTDLVEFKEKYISLIQEFQSKHKDVLILSLPPIDPAKYINCISQNRNRENILKWLDNDVEFMRGWHEIYNIAVHEVAFEANAEIIDITAPFLSRRNYTNFLCEDGIHPNEKGHAIIAQAISKHLETVF